jgi:hypothetical protein
MQNRHITHRREIGSDKSAPRQLSEAERPAHLTAVIRSMLPRLPISILPLSLKSFSMSELLFWAATCAHNHQTALCAVSPVGQIDRTTARTQNRIETLSRAVDQSSPHTGRKLLL